VNQKAFNECSGKGKGKEQKPAFRSVKGRNFACGKEFLAADWSELMFASTRLEWG